MSDKRQLRERKTVESGAAVAEDELLQQRDKIHGRHAERKDIVIAKFLQKEEYAFIRTERAVTKAHWELLEGGQYEDHLELGDVIAIQSPKNLDERKRFYNAEVIYIGTNLAVAKKFLENQKKGSRGKCLLTPSKKAAGSRMLLDLDSDPCAGEDDDPPAWKFDPFTGKAMGRARSATPDYSPSLGKISESPKGSLGNGSKKGNNREGSTESEEEPVYYHFSSTMLTDSQRKSNIDFDNRINNHEVNRARKESGSKCLSTGTPQHSFDTDYRNVSGHKMVSLRPYLEKRNAEKSSWSSFPKQQHKTPNTTERSRASTSMGNESSPARELGIDTTRKRTALGTPATEHKKMKICRTVEQNELLARLHRSWTNRGSDSVELFQGCKRYLPRARIENFKFQMTPKRPGMDAVNLALMFFESTENVLTLFTGDRFGLKHACGSDMIGDMLAFINGYHPGVTSKKALPVKEDALLLAFSRKVYYLRTSHAKHERSGYDADVSGVDVDIQ